MKEKLLELIRFGMVGVTATLIQYAVYYVLLPYMDERVALTIGYVISFCCNYVMTTHFTFRVKASPRNAGGFALSHGINWSLQVSSLTFFIWMGVPKEWAPIPMYMVCVPVNFLMVRFFVKR
ncbi:MAG: GtrA family protein [Prevotella sp.]|jgi:putative flippase GtrA|nr:GtrA family protein [Prevotella sp.]